MDGGYNEKCRQAMEQGYADLAHKMNCDLPNTGSNLLPWGFLILALFVIGAILVYATSRGKMGK